MDQVPRELEQFSLYRLDKHLCERWAEVYPIWVETYKGISVLHEIRKAHAWEVCNPASRKSDRPRFLNTWLSKAHSDWYRRSQEGGLKFAGRAIPDLKRPISCKRCLDSGLVPSSIKTRWGEDRPAMGRCPDCAFKRVAQ